MNYTIEINNRPWIAIKNKTKDIEIRTNTSHQDIDYRSLIVGDTISFINNDTQELLDVKVLRVTHYNTITELLEKEGTKKTLSSGKDINGGIESINSLDGYKEGIKMNGVWAIKIKTIEE